jgi:hypothetical protein
VHKVHKGLRVTLVIKVLKEDRELKEDKEHKVR